MFPLADLQLLLEFARGKTAWGIEVFDASIRVLSYFGRMFISQGAPGPVVGANDVRISEDEAIAALDNLTQAPDDAERDGSHPVAGISPILILTVLRFVIQVLGSKA